MSNYNGTGIAIIIGYIYLLISQIFALYFWWEWSQDHNFFSSLFIGPIVGEIKGLLWIFFIWDL